MIGVAAGLMQGRTGVFAERMQGQHLYVLGYSASVFSNSVSMLIVALGLSGQSNGYRATVAVARNNLAIHDYFCGHPAWIHLVVPTANWESNHLPLSVAYNHQATTQSASLLGSRLATRLAHSGVLGCILTTSVYPKLKYLNSACGGLAPPLNGLSKFTYLYYLSY